MQSTVLSLRAPASAGALGISSRAARNVQQAAITRRNWLGQRRGSRRAVVAAASEGTNDPEETFALAPSKPTSPQGQMLAYYLQMQPHLFSEAIDGAFTKIKEQRESDAQQEQQQQQGVGEGEGSSSSAADLVLYQRMAEVRRAEQRHAIEDLMYICILERFQEIGVRMLPAVDVMEESRDALHALTEGVHSREALDMVKEHVLSILGPASMAYSNTMMKMSKLQAAQVYAASIMFGYFLRRVDSRFQLAARLGMLPEAPEDAVARLERLFAQADSSPDPDAAPPADEQPSTSYTPAGEQQQGRQQQQQAGLVKRPKSALRRYVESFDQTTMIETARLVTLEGAALVERQTKALFGDIKQLQQQMQDAVGQDALSVEDLMERVQQAVADGAVDVVTTTVGTQRRAVLEAVAYGCFLRDVETDVNDKYSLLTPLSSANAADV